MDNSFQDNLRNLLAWFLDVRSLVLDSEGEHRPEEIAEHIACCYRNLNIDAYEVKKVEVLSNFITDEYFKDDELYRRPVKKLYDLVNSVFSDYITHFYLHGSLATQDYKKGWSDLDTFMVIKKDVVTSKKKLLELRKICLDAWPIFLEITPFQHHGFIVVSEHDLESYSSHFLPPIVLEKALSFKSNQGPLVLNLRKKRSTVLYSFEERKKMLKEAVVSGVFKHHPKNGVYLSTNLKNAKDNMYQLFVLIGYVANVPAYFLDGISKSTYKRESFKKARLYFSDEAWNVVEKATQIRELWPDKEGQKYKGNEIPKWMLSILGDNFFGESIVLLEEAIEKIKSS